MSDIEEKKVLKVIGEKYSELFQAEKKVANYIMKNPEDWVRLNVTELANNCGTSDATVIRFCKHVGYEGFYQMKLYMSRDIGSNNVTKYEMDTAEDNTLQSYCNLLLKEIAQIPDLNEGTSFLDAVKIIKESKQVYLFAAGNTATQTRYMEFRLERMGKRCSSDTQPEFVFNHISLAEEGDCLVVVSYTGTTKLVVQAIEQAKKRNMKVIVITAYKYSPVASQADCLLLAPMKTLTGENSRFSLLTLTYVIDLLLEFLDKEVRNEMNIDLNPEMVLASTKF